MTKDRQKKSLHHNKTSREYGGGIRGLAGLPWVAAEVLEGYFSGWGVHSEKCCIKTPSWAPQPTKPEPERNPNNIQL